MIAGVLCLDFINTLDDRFSDEPKELLNSYLDLARFGEDAGILSEAQGEHLFQLCQQSPARAKQTLEAAVPMREAMYAVFWALVQKKPVPKAQLMILNSYAQQAARHMTLVETNGRFEIGRAHV